ncbi:MAG: hypothetical protein KAS69_07425 [Planctomycetes bacterium]|nr:hypothetical protein [Planctomycetota bacterium]
MVDKKLLCAKLNYKSSIDNGVIMNTFWLKILLVMVAVAGLFILVNIFLPAEKAENEQVQVEQPEQKTFYTATEQDDKRLRAEPNADDLEIQFKKLSLEDEVQADKLFEMALFHRKSGRLPVMGYGRMVDYCRQLIEKYPDSVYAFKARRMLSDIPQKYRKLYKITSEETDF